MSIISQALGSTIRLASQTGTMMGVGTTIGIAAGAGAAQKIVEKAQGLVSDDASFVEVSPLKQAACLGLVATNRALHAGFRAFDQKVSSWLKPNQRGGEVTDSIKKALTLDELIDRLRGPEHKQAVEALTEVVLHGTEENVIYLFGMLKQKSFREDFDPIYFALSKRPSTSFSWFGKYRHILDDIK